MHFLTVSSCFLETIIIVVIIIILMVEDAAMSEYELWYLAMIAGNSANHLLIDNYLGPGTHKTWLLDLVTGWLLKTNGQWIKPHVQIPPGFSTNPSFPSPSLSILLWYCNIVSNVHKTLLLHCQTLRHAQRHQVLISINIHSSDNLITDSNRQTKCDCSHWELTVSWPNRWQTVKAPFHTEK